MSLAFARMHGCGNDFVVLDDRAGRLHALRSELARSLCNRRTGLGGDGLILIGPPVAKGTDVTMTYVNADGAEGEMCGNGARCVAWRAVDLGLAGRRLDLATLAGPIAATVSGRDVRLTMTDPRDLKAAVPLAVLGDWIEVHSVDTGVPHAVIFVADAAALATTEVVRLGREVRHHAHFSPRGANANFVAVIGPSRLAIRTFERGVEDETLACGTGAVAAAVIAHHTGRVGRPVTVEPRGGGLLEIDFETTAEGDYRNLTLSGPTELIAVGELSDAWLAARGLPLSADSMPKAMTSAGQLATAG